MACLSPTPRAVCPSGRLNSLEPIIGHPRRSPRWLKLPMSASPRLAVVLLAMGAFSPRVEAQVRAQLPGSTVADPTLQFASPPPASPGLAPVPPPPGGVLGAPVFDPYSTGAGASPGVAAPPPATWGPAAPTGPASSAWGGPGYYNQSPAFPAAPNAVFPGAPPPQTPRIGFLTSTMKFFQGPRLRHAWLWGDGGSDLQIHDTDLSLVFAWPNFMFSTQPLYVVPSFSLHLWNGPIDPTGTIDLPPRAYSGFLDFGWQSSPQVPVGAELGVRLGVYSDFNTITTDSFRIQGKALMLLRTTPTVQLRGGVYYVDRNRVKLLPGGGILWTPNPQVRFDIAFPNPKLSQYLTTVGNSEVWWYLAGEYGGGTWTVERTSGASDRVDINDIRVLLGVEWGPSEFFRIGRRLAFFEAAWITNRELVFRSGDRADLNDTFMLRAGFGY